MLFCLVVLLYFFFHIYFIKTHKQYEETVRRQQTDDTNRLLARHQQEENDLRQSAENELNELKQLQVCFVYLYMVVDLSVFTVQHYVSIVFTFVWSIRTALISDTQNFRILNCACV